MSSMSSFSRSLGIQLNCNSHHHMLDVVNMQACRASSCSTISQSLEFLLQVQGLQRGSLAMTYTSCCMIYDLDRLFLTVLGYSLSRASSCSTISQSLEFLLQVQGLQQGILAMTSHVVGYARTIWHLAR